MGVNAEGRRNVVIASSSTFAGLLAAFAGVRLWNRGLPAAVEAHFVEGVALLMVVIAAYGVYRGGDRIDSVILAFGPALAFALNFLFSGWAGVDVQLIGLATLGAGFFAIVPAALGYLVGYAVRER